VVDRERGSFLFAVSIQFQHRRVGDHLTAGSNHGTASYTIGHYTTNFHVPTDQLCAQFIQDPCANGTNSAEDHAILGQFDVSTVRSIANVMAKFTLINVKHSQRSLSISVHSAMMGDSTPSRTWPCIEPPTDSVY
jgi:hypothetical protein